MNADYYREDPKPLLVAAAIAFLVEISALTGIAWHEHWLSHPQKTTGLDPSQFIEAQVVEMPPPEEARLRSAQPALARKSAEPVLSKVPHQGRKAEQSEKTAEPEANVTDPGAPPMAPTHGPIAVFTPKPVIPEYLKNQEIKASVVIEFLISSQAVVTPRLLGSSGNEELDQIALATARQWKFRPAEQDHRSQDSKVKLRILFEVH